MTTIEKIRKDNRFFLAHSKQLRAETIAAGDKVGRRLEGTINILEVAVAHDEATVKEWAEWLALVKRKMLKCFEYADNMSDVEMREWFEGVYRAVDLMYERAVDNVES